MPAKSDKGCRRGTPRLPAPGPLKGTYPRGRASDQMAAAPPGDSRACAALGVSGAGGWRGSSLSRLACRQARVAATASAPRMAPATRLAPKFKACRMIIAVPRTADGHKTWPREPVPRREGSLQPGRPSRPCMTRSSRFSSHRAGQRAPRVVCLLCAKARVPDDLAGGDAGRAFKRVELDVGVGSPHPITGGAGFRITAESAGSVRRTENSRSCQWTSSACMTRAGASTAKPPYRLALLSNSRV